MCMINNFHGVWALISIWVAGISGVFLIGIYISRSTKYKKIGKKMYNPQNEFKIILIKLTLRSCVWL